jgi:hypothetical protein
MRHPEGPRRPDLECVIPNTRVFSSGWRDLARITTDAPREIPPSAEVRRRSG